MTVKILIVDNDNEQAAYRFEQAVRPLLKSPVESDVVKSVLEAEELLRANDYPLAIVESIVHKKPVDLDNPFSMDLEELVCPADRVIPGFTSLRPRMKIIVSSHSRSRTSKEEKARLEALPGVIGVFGWLNATRTAKKVAKLLEVHVLSG